jgi:hypothetical protein
VILLDQPAPEVELSVGQRIRIREEALLVAGKARGKSLSIVALADTLLVYAFKPWISVRYLQL